MQTLRPHGVGRNVPAFVTQPLVGRERDVETVLRLLTSDTPRIITLTGPGGVGKTSLALAVAKRASAFFGDRVHLILLASLTDPEHLLSEMAHQLGLAESSGSSTFDRVATSLSAGETLLILDNFEQLVDASLEIAQLATAAAGLRILITSREALGIRQEVNYSVHPLAVDAPTAGERGPAVELFLSCAARAGAHFEHTGAEMASVRQICERLDGLPLAIELASTWTPSLTPSAITRLLERNHDALRSRHRDAPDRHRTLRAAISWSYDLLSAEEKHFFRAMSTFNGPFDISAAARLSAHDQHPDEIRALNQIAALINKNLAKATAVEPGQEDRYELLETIRAFGREQARETGEDTAYRDAHAQHYLEFVEQSIVKLISPERVPTLERLDREYPNIRTAMSWFIDRGSIDAAHRLLAQIWRYWEPRGLLAEGRSWADAVLAMPGEVDAETRAWALYGAAVMPMRQGDFRRSQQLATDCMTHFQSIGHKRGTAFALNILGILAYDVGDFERAIATHREALALRLEDGEAHLIETSTVNLAIALLMAGELEESGALYQQAYEMETARGHTHGIAYALNGLGLVAERRGDLKTAQSHHARAVELRRGEDTGSLAASLVNLASVLRSQGEWEDALRRYQEAIELRHHRGEIPGLLEAIEGTAWLAAEMGASDQAATMLATILERRSALGINKVDPFGTRSILVPIDTEKAQPVSVAELVDLALGLQVPGLAATSGEDADSDRPHLTDREREVLERLAAGKSDQEIAGELFIARATASRHVANIFAKLGVSTRTAAAAWSVRQDTDTSR